MPVSFDWEFKEEQDLPPRPTEGVAPSARRWRRWGALVLLLLVVGGLLTRAWINERLNAVEKVEAQLGSIVELELKNIAAGDSELFRARQDPADSYWQTRQIRRYISARADFVPAPGLVPADRSSEIKKVHVFGHTGRVELVQWFQSSSDPLAPGAPRPSDPLPFHVTWFYRLDDDGVWYHTASPDGYWGAQHSWHGVWLDVYATRVESEVLDPLARDLAALVSDGCRLVGCPRGARYRLSFEDRLAPHIQGNRWTLPALYLTGLPEGQAARDAWLHALQLWMVEALVRTRVDGAAITDRVIYRHLVTRLQAELGLTEPFAPDIERLTQALRDGEQHTLQSLFTARYDPADPEGNRLLDAEVAALLQWLELQVGPERLFELLPLMYSHDLSPNAGFQTQWLAYLSQLTYVTADPVTVSQAAVQLLEPPLVSSPSPVPPGDHIAFICDNRIWVGNADGSNVVPLTGGGGGFEGLVWSPDGRWLLTTWRPNFNYRQSGLYLLAADGSGIRLVAGGTRRDVWPAGWSPDGGQAIYLRSATSLVRGAQAWAADVETGEVRQLPGAPTWSPDGEHLIYATESFADSGSTLWLADADWANPRQIAAQVRMGAGASWSPDSSRLALVLGRGRAESYTIVSYDLATMGFTYLAVADDLRAAVLSSAGDFLTDGTDPTLLEDAALQSLWVPGWSPDGRQLLALAQWQRGNAPAQSLMALLLVPLDGSPPQVLAYGEWGGVGSAAWSPTDPDRLTAGWSTQLRRGETSHAYLFDLHAGPIYTATSSWNATWSPDGGWVAFVGPDRVTIVDRAGQPHFDLSSGVSCFTAAWNPAADLSALSSTQ